MLSLSCSFLQVDNADTEDLKLMTEYKGTPIQIPIAKGSAKSTNHKGNVIDAIRQIYNKPVSLVNIGINTARNTKIHRAITEMSAGMRNCNHKRK